MPIIVKTNSDDSNLDKWAIIEIQGDLLVRDNENIFEQFIGDLYYNKFGQPLLIVGHHILQGREQIMEKPLAVLEKTKCNEDHLFNITDSQLECSNLNSTVDKTILDSTVALENKSHQTTEYTVRAIISKKLIFRSRPKPIIANVPKQI